MEQVGKIQIAEINGSNSKSQSLQRQVSPSRIEGLKLALAKMSLLRGEVMDAVRLESYSKALADGFSEDADMLAVMERLVKTRRAEYEAKIPELGELLQLVRDQRTERRRVAREAREREEREALERRRREHPEDFCTLESIWEDYERMKAAKLATAPGVSIEAFIAEHTTPEAMAEVRESMAALVATTPQEVREA